MCVDLGKAPTCLKDLRDVFLSHPNVPKLCSFMNMTSKSKNVKFAKFISCIFELI